MSIKILKKVFIKKDKYVIFRMLYYRKGDNMITNEKTEKYFIISVIAFITYLLLGSFVVSGDFLELGYLIIFYLFIIVRIKFCK